MDEEEDELAQLQGQFDFVFYLHHRDQPVQPQHSDKLEQRKQSEGRRIGAAQDKFSEQVEGSGSQEVNPESSS